MANFVTDEQKNKAKDIDLLSYMMQQEPYNLKNIGHGTYCTVEHDSLKITRKGWYWWSRHIGGVSALDYLIKVKEMPFVDAVKHIVGEDYSATQKKVAKDIPFVETSKELQLPPKNKDNSIAKLYLQSRGIDKGIINDFIQEGTLYESEKWHNVVFVGRNENGKDVYGSLRSTGQKMIKIDCSGSSKSYSFRSVHDTSISTIHVFEGAIDLLSYATYLKLAGYNYKTTNMIAMSGIYMSKSESNEEIKIQYPKALKKYLDTHECSTVYLHLDNDEVGRAATAQIKKQLEFDGYNVKDVPAKRGKDWNDYLQLLIKENQFETYKANRDRKYELTTEIKVVDGIKLSRIRALKDFSDVKKGELGGYVQSEKNLSQIGNAWVYFDGAVMDNAIVKDNAAIIGPGIARDNVMIEGSAGVRGICYGSARIGDDAVVLAGTEIKDNAYVGGEVRVRTGSIIGGNACIKNAAEIKESIINGNSIIKGNSVITNSEISGDVIIENKVITNKTVFSIDDIIKNPGRDRE